MTPSALPYGVIDAHTHINPLHLLHEEAEAVFRSQHGKAWRHVCDVVGDPKALLGAMDSAGIERVVMVNYISPDVTGYTPEINDWVLNYSAAAPERLLPVGSVHPRLTLDAGAEVRRLVEAGVRAFKLHPAHQLVYPNAYREDPQLAHMADMYEEAQAAGVPFIFHTGTSIFPKARVKYADPLALDDVLVDFPQLKVVMAHGGRPFWTQQCLFLLRRRSRVYIDISSIPPFRLPDYFPKLESLADSLLYGSDWPGPGPQELGSNIGAILALGLSDEVNRKILRDTALTVFWS